MVRAQCRECIEPLLWPDFMSYIPLNSLQIHGTLRSPRPCGSEKTKRPSLSYKWLSSLPVMGPKSETLPLISLSSPLCPSTPDLSGHLLNSKSMCFVPASCQHSAWLCHFLADTMYTPFSSCLSSPHRGTFSKPSLSHPSDACMPWQPRLCSCVSVGNVYSSRFAQASCPHPNPFSILIPFSSYYHFFPSRSFLESSLIRPVTVLPPGPVFLRTLKGQDHSVFRPHELHGS